MSLLSYVESSFNVFGIVRSFVIGTSDVVLYVPCFGVSFCTVSPSECLDYIYLGS